MWEKFIRDQFARSFIVIYLLKLSWLEVLQGIREKVVKSSEKLCNFLVWRRV